MGEFKVNEYITLKLENSRTNIYIEGKKFIQCKYVLIRKTVYKLEDFLENIESVDEMAEHLDPSLPIDIPPETRFWVHCSNLQVWVENNYDTRLLHSNLAFPLLKKLTQIGDPLAKRVFKDEIAKRVKSGHPSVIEFLLCERYLDYLNTEEIETLFEDLDLESIIRQMPGILIGLHICYARLGTVRINKNRFLFSLNHYDYPVIKNLIESNYIRALNRDDLNRLFENFDYGLILREDPYCHQVFNRLILLKAPNAKNFYRDWIFEKFKSGNNSEIVSLIIHGQIHLLDREDKLMLFDMIDYNYIMEHKEALTLFKHLKYLGAPNLKELYKDLIANLIKTDFDFYEIANEITRGVLDEYSIEDITALFRDIDYEHIAEEYLDIAPKFLEKLIKLGIQEAKEFYESEKFLKKILIESEIPFFLDLSPKLNLLRRRIVNKRIVDLNLKGCDLNEIPDSIGKLTQLQKINLLKNRLTSLPSSMSNLKLLKELELSQNQFNEFPSVISQLNSLEVLRLKINSIEEVPDTISSLKKINRLLFN
ncbi:MAG: leucine-rich repeat domain-containing protein [Promethearchaeota archaeon]|nr:MAG: leucine-rich repeat domain-containing protein [Candidatus Lokiarchaeota archaeon]